MLVHEIEVLFRGPRQGTVKREDEHASKDQGNPSLPSGQWAKLAKQLPDLFPEMDGDAAWESIVRDEHPRTAFNTLLNDVEATFHVRSLSHAS